MMSIIDGGTFFLGFVVGMFFALGGLGVVNIVFKLIGKKPIIFHIQAHDEKLLESIETLKQSVTNSHNLSPILEALQELKSKQESIKDDLESQQQTLHNLSQNIESIKDQTKPFEPPLPTQRW